MLSKVVRYEISQVLGHLPRKSTLPGPPDELVLDGEMSPLFKIENGEIVLTRFTKTETVENVEGELVDLTQSVAAIYPGKLICGVELTVDGKQKHLEAKPLENFNG